MTFEVDLGRVDERGRTEVPEQQAMPSLDMPSGGKWHWARHPFKHAICGCELDPASLTRKGDGPTCPHCERLMRLWIDHGIWEGFGKRRPGKDATEEIRWELGL